MSLLKHNKGIDTALRNAATMAGGSRSEGALGLGAALRRAGWTSPDVKAALIACPATRGWSCEADERQFERIWNRSTTRRRGAAGTEALLLSQTPSAYGTPVATTTSSHPADGCWAISSAGASYPRWSLTAALVRQLRASHSSFRSPPDAVSQASTCFLRCKVLVVSLEDDAERTAPPRLRCVAALWPHPRRHQRLPVPCRPKGLRLAEMKDGTPAAGALKTLIEQAIEQHAIDVVSLDTFIKSHGFDENSNNAIDFVCTMAAKIAIDLNCAIDLPHHTNKQVSRGPGDADRSRGASAMKDAARLVYTLNPMTPQEAESSVSMKPTAVPSSEWTAAKSTSPRPPRKQHGFGIGASGSATARASTPPAITSRPSSAGTRPGRGRDLDSALLNRILDDVRRVTPMAVSRYSLGECRHGSSGMEGVVLLPRRG